MLVLQEVQVPMETLVHQGSQVNLDSLDNKV